MSKKLFIQIPVFNEEVSIGEVLLGIPKTISGFDSTAVTVINDGSTDNTLDVVRGHGVEHIVNLAINKGLGAAFRKGLNYALANGADVIVNLDGDNQYSAQDITKIVTPILENRADVVVGNRQLRLVPGYPLYKLISQSIGNFLVYAVFHAKIDDATSGFRALNKDAARILAEKLTNDYTYTLESLCVLLRQKMRVMFIPVNIKYPTRQSRLIKSKTYYCFNFLSILFSFIIRAKPRAT